MPIREPGSGQGKGDSVDLDAGTAARLVAVLLITEEDDLEGYRQRCIGQDSDLPPDHLRAARDLLGVIGSTLLSSEETRWAQLLSARDALCPSPLDESSAPAPAIEEPAATPVAARPSSHLSPEPPPVASDRGAESPTEGPRESGPELPPPRPLPVTAATPSSPHPRSVPPPSPLDAPGSEPQAPAQLAPSPLPPPRTPPKPSAVPAAAQVDAPAGHATSGPQQRPSVGHSEPESTALISLPLRPAASGTGDEGARPAEQPVLPFQQDRSKPPPPPSHSKPKPSIPLGGTIGVDDILSPFHASPATPFEQEAAGGTPPSAERPPEPAPTMEVTPTPAGSSPAPAALTSGAPGTVEAPAPSSELATLEQEPPVVAEAQDDLASTIATDVGVPEDGTALIDPSAIRAGASPTPRLNIVAYAWLCAQCQAQPERTAELNVEHGLPTAQARQELDALWETRFQAEPHTRQRFAALLNHYRERGGP